MWLLVGVVGVGVEGIRVGCDGGVGVGVSGMLLLLLWLWLWLLLLLLLSLTRIKSVVTGQAPQHWVRYVWMAGKRLGQRDKEGVTVPLHAHGGRPRWPTHPMTSAVRLASSYTALLC